MPRPRQPFRVIVQFTTPLDDADAVATAFAGDMTDDSVARWADQVQEAIAAARSDTGESTVAKDDGRERRRRELETSLAEIQKQLQEIDKEDEHA